MQSIPIELPESIQIANLPTPIEELKVPEEYEFLPPLYIKRDDLTGVGLSGNKVRKLEFCMAEAVPRGRSNQIHKRRGMGGYRGDNAGNSGRRAVKRAQGIHYP